MDSSNRRIKILMLHVFFLKEMTRRRVKEKLNIQASLRTCFRSSYIILSRAFSSFFLTSKLSVLWARLLYDDTR